MIDPFGRRISYLRLSVTDRCDLRCTYCMPRAHDLPAARGNARPRRARPAGGGVHPQGRAQAPADRGRAAGAQGRDGAGRRAVAASWRSGALDELTLTTNGTRLAEHAADLARCGVRRINVSLDSLDPETYARITRGGRLDQVIAGIDAAIAAGLEVKINAVALRDDNLDDLVGLAEWAHARGAALTVIEVMPMGSVEAERIDQHVPMTEVRRRFEQRWTLTDLARRTGGPARYVRTDEGGTIGFITPLSRNFCDGCNRVRVTCTGEMYMCLGQAARADLRAPLARRRRTTACSTPRSTRRSGASPGATISSSAPAPRPPSRGTCR